MESLQRRIKLSFVDFLVYGLANLDESQKLMLSEFQDMLNQVEEIEKEIFSQELDVLSCLNKGDTVYFLKDYFSAINYFLNLLDEENFKGEIYELIVKFKNSPLQSENLDNFMNINEYLILDSSFVESKSQLKLFLKSYFSVEFFFNQMNESVDVSNIIDSLKGLSLEFMKIEQRISSLQEIYQILNYANRDITDSLVPRSFDTSENKLRFYAQDYLTVSNFDSDKKAQLNSLVRESIVKGDYNPADIFTFLRSNDEQ